MREATMSILGMYQFDETLFDELVLPDGVDQSVLVDNILAETAELECLYPSPPFMKFMIGNWSKRELPNWNKILEALSVEYNPAHDFMKNDEWSETGTETGTNNTSRSGDANSTYTDNELNTNSGTNTRGVAAYNSSTFENAEKTTVSNTGSNSADGTAKTTTSDSEIKSKNDKRTESGTRKSSGKIGVTSIAQYLRQEVDFRKDYNIYRIITESFVGRFCLMVY